MAEDSSTPLPSYCAGLVLYASFDAQLRADLGGGEPLALGSARLTATARFGGGLDLVADASDPDGSAALYFVRPDGGAAVFPDDEGTLSMWVRGSITDGTPVFYRSVGSLPPDPLVAAGLTLVSTGGQFGLVHTPPSSAVRNIHTFPVSAFRPYLRQGEFNHFATAWRRGDASGPTALLAINGGLGEILTDAGPDASDAYRDAAPTDAGSLRVPYRGYSSAKWDYDASSRALRLGAPVQDNVPQGTIDDVAVWSRVLSFDEIAATYTSGISIREACRLQ